MVNMLFNMHIKVIPSNWNTRLFIATTLKKNWFHVFNYNSIKKKMVELQLTIFSLALKITLVCINYKNSALKFSLIHMLVYLVYRHTRG